MAEETEMLRGDFAEIKRVIDQVDVLSTHPDKYRILKEMRDVMVAKGGDYSRGAPNTWWSMIASTNSTGHLTINQVFVVLIATKFSRLVALLSSDRPPKHEAVDDSILDAVNYMVLWAAWRRYRQTHADGEPDISEEDTNVLR